MTARYGATRSNAPVSSDTGAVRALSAAADGAIDVTAVLGPAALIVGAALTVLACARLSTR
jgi:hypothetical protein